MKHGIHAWNAELHGWRVMQLMHAWNMVCAIYNLIYNINLHSYAVKHAYEKLDLGRKSPYYNSRAHLVNLLLKNEQYLSMDTVT